MWFLFLCTQSQQILQLVAHRALFLGFHSTVNFCMFFFCLVKNQSLDCRAAMITTFLEQKCFAPLRCCLSDISKINVGSHNAGCLECELSVQNVLQVDQPEATYKFCRLFLLLHHQSVLRKNALSDIGQNSCLIPLCPSLSDILSLGLSSLF